MEIQFKNVAYKYKGIKVNYDALNKMFEHSGKVICSLLVRRKVFMNALLPMGLMKNCRHKKREDQSLDKKLVLFFNFLSINYLKKQLLKI